MDDGEEGADVPTRFGERFENRKSYLEVFVFKSRKMFDVALENSYLILDQQLGLT